MAPELTAVFLLKGIDSSNTLSQNNAIIQLALGQLSVFTKVPENLSEALETALFPP